MTIDTSAVVAILFGEPAAEIFAEAIEGAAVRLISVASVLEAAIVVESELGDPGAPEKDAKVSLRVALTRCPSRSNRHP